MEKLDQHLPPIFHIPQLDDIPALRKEIQELREEVRTKNALSEYIAKEDFQERFKIKSGLFYKIVNSEVLKTYRINRRIYFRQSEVDEALRNGLLENLLK